MSAADHRSVLAAITDVQADTSVSRVVGAMVCACACRWATWWVMHSMTCAAGGVGPARRTCGNGGLGYERTGNGRLGHMVRFSSRSTMDTTTSEAERATLGPPWHGRWSISTPMSLAQR
jgi:hypothetical protein